jgi:hypothetical protein
MHKNQSMKTDEVSRLLKYYVAQASDSEINEVKIEENNSSRCLYQTGAIRATFVIEKKQRTKTLPKFCSKLYPFHLHIKVNQ